MIPLLVQKNYSPKGWLGLLLGTKLYYRFYDGLELNEKQWILRVDALIREIGDRGRTAPAISEATPPVRATRAPASSRVPATKLASTASKAPAAMPVPSPTPAPAPAPAPAPDTSQMTPPRHLATLPAAADPCQANSSPSMVSRPVFSVDPSNGLQSAPRADTLLELSQFFKEMRQDAKQEREEMEARLRKELSPSGPVVTKQQLVALQTRLGMLHSKQLLEDQALFVLEDLCADYLALGLTTEGANVNLTPAATKLEQLVRVSEGMPIDASFARQCTRLFV
jgi:hypothetical protein